MKNLNEIYSEAEENDIMICEHKIGSRRSAIARIDNLTAIAVNKNMIHSRAEEKTALMHELGHFHANAYYTITSEFEVRSKKEYRARPYAATHYLPAEELKAAFQSGYTEAYQLAELFDVTEDFIRDAVLIHRQRGDLD